MNVPIRQAVEQYRRALSLEGKADSTRRVYITAVSRLADVFECEQRRMRHQPYVSFLAPSVIDDWFAQYGSDHTRNTALTALKHFIPWCVRRRYLTSDDAAVLLDRKVTIPARRPKIHLQASNFADALDIAGEVHPRDRAAVAVGLFTSYRESEIGAIQLGNVDLDGDIRVYRTKTKDYLSCPVGPDLREELELWLPCYAEQMGYKSPRAMMDAHPKWPLIPHIARSREKGASGRFVTNDSLPFTIYPERPGARLENIVKRILTGLGIQGEKGVGRDHLGEGMHMLRRSSAEGMIQHLVELGYDHGTALVMVSKRLGHASVKTTEGYLDTDRMKRQADDFVRDNHMFGRLRPNGVPGGATVVPLRSAQKGAEATNTPNPANRVGAGSQAL
jgi:integrase